MTFSGEVDPGVLAQRVADLIATSAPRSIQTGDVMGIANRNLDASPRRITAIPGRGTHAAA